MNRKKLAEKKTLNQFWFLYDVSFFLKSDKGRQNLQKLKTGFLISLII